MERPDGSKQNCTTFDELFQPLEAKLKQLEKDHPAHHREKLHLSGFVRLLVYHFVKGCESGRQLLTDVWTASPQLRLDKVKRSTFFDAFQRFPVAWFASLLTFLLTAITWKAIPELDALGKLYCVDGSIFPALATMAWAEYKRNSPAIRLHLCFELNRMIAVQFLVDAGNSNEKQALLEMLEANVTYIADRGYLSFALLAAIEAAKSFFVIRAKSNLVYTRTQRLSVSLPAVVKSIFHHVTDQRVRLTNAENQPIYRLVTFQVDQERYLILTNRRDLTTFQVILLYAYRWQVELIFKYLKRSMKGLHLLSHTQEGVTIHFYTLLITALLELHLKQRCVDLQDAGSPSHLTDQDESRTPPVAGLMINPDDLAGTRGGTFLATVGKKLSRYWKISIHWLVALRNYLAQPFDQQVIAVLGTL